MPVASLRPVPLSLTVLAAPEKPCDTFLPVLRIAARRLMRLSLSRPACLQAPDGRADSSDPACVSLKASDAA
jgi:hypothetical protein